MGTKTRVTGSWLPEDHPGYEAEVDDIRWNGWAVPRFTEEVARQVTADQATLRAEFLASGGEPDDMDQVLVTNDPVTFVVLRGTGDPEQYDSYDHEVSEADDDGLFSIGGWSWCWEEVR